MNYILINERRVIDLGREAGERRKQMDALHIALENAKTRFQLSIYGLAGSIAFILLYLSN